MNNRDTHLIEKIVSYCMQIKAAQDMFGNQEATFMNNIVYQNACCMCILQIGELAGRLSNDAQTAIHEIPWKAIRGMRNALAHNYMEVDLGVTWATICDDIPILRAACEHYLDSNE